MAKVELAGNADAVEFCPNEPYCHILAAASYTLQEGDDGGAARLGGLYLFSAKQVLTQSYRQDTAGVFDIKWRPYNDGPPCLAQASADGCLSLYLLEDGSEPSTVELHEKASVDVSTSMCLYVDWNPLQSNPEVVLSHSDGSLSVVDVGQAEVSASWEAHGFEAWVVAYDAWQPRVVYSGGDDCQFCCWDLREDPSRRPVFRDKRTHTMGVCSIQSNSLWDNMLITGSYDERLRLFDVRMAQKPPLLEAELALGGGVWRLKWHPTRRDILLAACMHNGAAIARLGEGGGFQVLESYRAHASLTYGASWYRGGLNSLHTPLPDVIEGDQTMCSSVGAKSRGEGANPQNAGGAVMGALDSRSVVVTGSQGEEDADGAFSSSSVAESAGEVAHEVSGGTGVDRMAEGGGNGSEAESFGELGQLRLVPAVVATCSFYDRAVHLWRPKSVALL